LRDETALEYLVTMLKDDDRFVRQEAARALGKIGSTRASESLTQALLKEKNEFVKDAMKKAVDKLQSGQDSQ
jgi:HEAT repeat protein